VLEIERAGCIMCATISFTYKSSPRLP